MKKKIVSFLTLCCLILPCFFAVACKDKEKEEPAHPPDGGADPYGDPPEGWNDEWEKDFMNEIYQNPGTTRAEWYDFWHVDEEGGAK